MQPTSEVTLLVAVLVTKYQARKAESLLKQQRQSLVFPLVGGWACTQPVAEQLRLCAALAQPATTKAEST